MLNKIGLQTFTIRNEIKDIQKLEKVLLFFKKQGICNFELSRIKFSEEELVVLKKLHDKKQLNFTAIQVPLHKIKKHFDWYVKFCSQLNIKYIEVSVIPTINFIQGEKGITSLAKTLNKLGKETKKHNINLLYHHHNFELINFGNILSIDKLLNETDEAYVNLVADTYWIAMAGLNPKQFLLKRKNRIKGVHLRDCKMVHKLGKFSLADTTIGKGNINFKEILSCDNELNVDFYSIEQNSENPLQDVKFAYNNIVKCVK